MRRFPVLSHPSLRRRLTGYSFLLSLLLLTIAWAAATYASERYTVSRFQAVLEAVSVELLDEMEEGATARSDFPEMVEEINEAAAQTSERLVVLHVSGESVLGRSHPDGPPWPNPEGGDWLVSVLPYHGDELVAALFFGDIKDGLLRQAVVLAAVCVLVLVTVTVGTWHLVGAVLSPITALSQQAREAAANLETRLSAPSGDAELTELVETLNRFLERLTSFASTRSRFYAAASHELRTPLQGLSGHLELALDKERSAAEYRRALEEAQRQSQRLLRLTSDLLTLNRLELGSDPHLEPVDLADQCELELIALRPLLHERGLQLSTRFPVDAELQAPPGYLAMVVRNLLENAVKYTPEGGTVDLAVTVEGSPKLSVINDAEPISEPDFDKLGEPFFRPDTSRSSKLGGNGLGLAIVSSIAVRQGWSLERRLVDGRFVSEVTF